MQKFLEKLEQFLMPIAEKLATNKYVSSVSEGMVGTVPFIIIGSLFLIVAYLPINGWSEMLANIGLINILTIPYMFTISLIALYAVYLIASALARKFDHEKDATTIGLLSILSFLMVNGLTPDGNIGMTYLGAAGIFTAIIVALVTARLYIFIKDKGLTIKMPAGVPQSVSDSFTAIIPGLIVIVLWLIVFTVLASTPYGTLATFIFAVLQSGLTRVAADNIWGWFLLYTLNGLFWFFGIHGGAIVGAIATPLLMPLSLANVAAVQAGGSPTNIITDQFYTYCGSGIALSLIMMFACKSKRYKTLGKVTLPTSLFGITEPITFGLPTIMNTMVFIPAVFSLPVIGLLTYLVMKAGLVAIPVSYQLPFTTPVVLHGFLQGGISVAIWEIIATVLNGLIYYPFIKIMDNKALKEEMEAEKAAENN